MSEAEIQNGSESIIALGSAPLEVSGLRLTLAFLIILFLCGVLLWSRIHQKNPKSFLNHVFEQKAQRIQLIERCRISPDHSVAIVRVDDTEYLLALSPNGIDSLEKLSIEEHGNGCVQN